MIYWFNGAYWDYRGEAPLLLGALGQQIGVTLTMGLSLALAFWLRRRAVILVALGATPIMVLYWLPAFV